MQTFSSSLAVFESFKIRRVYDQKAGKWFFSVIDVTAVLIDQNNYQTARKYWNKLAERLKKEGSQSVTNCHRLKLKAADGKFYKTDVADTETLLRIIQSIPSKKAEPLKLWLARVGYERIQEIADPEKALNRSREYWQRQGRSPKWIQQRMLGQETRNKLTDYWSSHGVEKKNEFAILTNIIHHEWSGLSIQKHKKIKNLSQENLRDHMSDAELIFTDLAELSTRQIAEGVQAYGVEQNKNPARQGGQIAKNAKNELEQKTGKPVINSSNYKFVVNSSSALSSRLEHKASGEALKH